MNFNKKILYALMVAGLCMPATSVYAVWPFSSGPAAGAAPLLKIQEKLPEKTKEEVKKEATAQSARLLSAAVRGTGFVASKTAHGVMATTNEAVRLGLKYPYATTALVAGGTVYYYRNEIKEKVKNAAAKATEFAGKAAPYAATATALAAAKYGYDWCKSLFGSRAQAAPVQNNQVLPIVADPVAAPVNNWANEFAQQNAAASQTEKAKVEPVVPVTAPAAPAQDWAQEFNASHSVPRTNSAELRRMESAWKHIEEVRLAQEKAQKEDSEAKAEQKARLANTAKARANIFASHDIKSAQNNAQEFYGKSRLTAQVDNQLMDAFMPREFTFEQLAQDKLNELTNMDITAMPYEPQESGAQEWAQEFIESNKHEDAEALEWVEEYKAIALNRARRIMEHLVPTLQAPRVPEVRSLEDISSRMHQREMITTVDNLMPHCAPSSLRPL